MSEDRVAQECVGQPSQHCRLHCRHHFARFDTKRRESQDAVAFGLDQHLDEAARLAESYGSRARGRGALPTSRGECPRVVRLPPSRLSRTTRKASKATCVKCGLPAQSPIAHTPGAVVSNRALTLT